MKIKKKPSALHLSGHLTRFNTALYVTRWVDRPQHPNFAKTLLQDSEWARAGVDLHVAVHGKIKNFDSYPVLDKGEVEGRWKVLNCCFANPNCFIPSLVSLCLQDAFQRGYQAVGIMDDDAMFEDPYLLGDRVRTIVSNAPEVGAFGPVGSYRFMARYKGVEDRSWWPVEKRPWALVGCQWYSRAHVEAFLTSGARYYYDQQMRCNDVFHCLFTQWAGLDLAEFHVKGYHHRSSRGVQEGYTQAWYERMLEQYVASHKAMKAFFSQKEPLLGSKHPQEWYLEELRKSRDYHFNFIHSKALSEGLKVYDTPA